MSMRSELVNLDDSIPDIAAGWFALQRSGKMTEEDTRAFTAWLEADAQHRSAFEAAERAWTGVEAARAHPDVLALREAALHKHVHRARGGAWAGLAIAASLSAIIGGGAFIYSGALSDIFAPPAEHLFRTSVGQRTTMTLPDGSIVTLDTDTVLRTIESRRERRIELERGQAFFQVAKDHKRPFVVVAGEKTVTATGTAFDVRLDPGRFELTMVEGKVRVEAPDEKAEDGKTRTANMTAGKQLVALDDAKWEVRFVDPDRETAWVRGQLIYDSAPLSRVVSEINRYSEKKIVIADAELAQQPVNGTFRAGDVDGFIKALEDYDLARVQGETDTAVRIVAK